MIGGRLMLAPVVGVAAVPRSAAESCKSRRNSVRYPVNAGSDAYGISERQVEVEVLPRGPSEQSENGTGTEVE
jgi:hypothetical protein